MSACAFRPVPFRRLSLAVIVAGLLLGGCALRPKPITEIEHQQRAAQDYQTLAANYAPVAGKLTLPEAVARALKYNYDVALSKTELSLQEQQLDQALAQMLPRLAADAGYNWRSNDNAAQSVSVVTHQPSLDYSYSTERRHGTADLQFSWNALDVGVSYFQAKQQGYRAFMAVERRRKVISGMVKDVQAAYWKAVAADRLLRRLEPLMAKANHVLASSREANRQSLQPPLQALDFQQSMLQVIAQLKRMRNELMASKIQLAALIGAPPSAQFAIDDRRDAGMPATHLDLRKLEELSLVLRPELREAAYQEKINRQDIYKEYIKMLPGVGMLSSVNFDTNRLLYNNIWSELGVRATLNLVNLVQGPLAIRSAKTSVEVARARRVALSVAVLTQVNLAYQQYRSALDAANSARAIERIGEKIRRASNNAAVAEAQPDAERIRRAVTAMVGELDYYRAVIDVRTAYANLYTAAGIDIIPPSAPVEDLPALAEHVDTALRTWQSGRLPDADPPEPQPRPTEVAATLRPAVAADNPQGAGR